MSLRKRIGGRMYSAIGDVQVTPACLQYEAGAEQLTHGTVTAMLEIIPVVELVKKARFPRTGNLVRVVLRFGDEQYDACFNEFFPGDLRIQPNPPVTLKRFGDEIYAVLNLRSVSIKAKFKLYDEDDSKDPTVH